GRSRPAYPWSSRRSPTACRRSSRTGRAPWGPGRAAPRRPAGHLRGLQPPRQRPRRGKRPAAEVDRPVLLAAGPALGAVLNHSPVVNLDDIVVGEIVDPAFSRLAKGSQKGDNRFPQLVFHEVLLRVMLQELS